VSSAPAPTAHPHRSAPAQPKPGIQAPAKQVAASAITPGFVVQLGMFTSVEHAQALRAQLEAQGIPVFLETRVVVGPFRDRAEADAARKRLNALGVAGVLAQRK
jgi:cell division septation protein DedD